MGPELAAVQVSAGYRGRPVIQDIDLAFGTGIHILLGPNGAGKTTTFRVLCGVLTPISGRVLAQGRDLHQDVDAKLLIGVAAHRSGLAPLLSAADNLRYWSRVLGLPVRQRAERIEQVLDILGLAEIADRPARTLSRGQSQRVGLAKAFLADPPVLLLDEPMAGVDPGIAAKLRLHLRALAESGRTVVASTHSLAEAYELADDVTVVHRGRIIGRGEPAELRRMLLGQAYRVRVRGRGDVTAALSRLGYRTEEARQGGVVVEVAGEDEVESMVRGLTDAGVGLHEVSPLGNPLDDVYQALQAGGGRDV